MCVIRGRKYECQRSIINMDSQGGFYLGSNGNQMRKKT